MADRPDVLADGDDAHGEAHADVLAQGLLDDAADQEDEDTAALVALDCLDGLLVGGGGADHDDEAGDIAGDEGDAQLADLSVAEVAVVRGALVGGGSSGVFAGLDDLGGDGGGYAAAEHGVGVLLMEESALDLGEDGLQLAQGGNLPAEEGIAACEVISRVGQLHIGVGAKLGDDGVDFLLGFGVHFV